MFDLGHLVDQVISHCPTSQTVNPSGPNQGESGQWPGANWEIDYTEIKPGTHGCKYLLVSIDNFSGWVEAYPT